MSQENNNSKSVQFSRFIKISFTYPGDEYDRSALEPAKLTFSEASELMQLRIDWKQEMNRRVEEKRQQLLMKDTQDSEDGYSSDEARVPRLSGPTSRSAMRSDSDCSSQSSEDEEFNHGHIYKKGIVKMHRQLH
ncbi:hypothetical protein BGZ58_005758 [Dissophora ornata]|nr:hypothetical protein BGZ58_005758 [Dissophora ornata]